MAWKTDIDPEWIELMQQARELGLELEEVRWFLLYQGQEEREISV
ncbi:anti-repressor SinI family protein [Domibacillus sp. DTU_2020_1001157_1_SI_ALB_TIR_016]|nr:anti-repressor SinI family protein [Domibacillus sp. DTU_2020_1001157_1_SI_ALB_TIR_016]WNS81225.1 anti-repressor SinI family protein [Domibacillus sp. DTU_2020_1001157_1_SI_ALB_TIR_016]